MFRTPTQKRLAHPDEEWSRTDHLLALLTEVVSVRVAGKQLKKPVDIPRPGKKGKGADRGQRQQEQQQGSGNPLMKPPPPPSQQRPQSAGDAANRDAAFKQGIAVLASTRFKRKG